MMEPLYLKYINLQYWYCLIYSIFGGKCTEVDPVIGSASAGISASAATAPDTQGSSDFWGWLFGGNGGAATGATPAAHTGIFGPLVDGVFFIGSAIGAVISFIWSVYSFLAYTVSGLLFIAIIGLLFYLFSIRFNEGALYGALPPAKAVVHPLRERWHLLLEGARSSDPKRWRQGILEADEMLGEVFTKLGYPGKTTSEQIKLVPDTAFVTLPFAWEAHRIRNFVAAPSSNYILTQQEAFRVMKLYEQVFQEFSFI